MNLRLRNKRTDRLISADKHSTAKRHHSGHFRSVNAEVWDPHPQYEFTAFGRRFRLRLAHDTSFVSPNMKVTQSPSFSNQFTARFTSQFVEPPTRRWQFDPLAWSLILLRLSEKLSCPTRYYYANARDIIADASVPELA